MSLSRPELQSEFKASLLYLGASDPEHRTNTLVWEPRRAEHRETLSRSIPWLLASCWRFTFCLPRRAYGASSDSTVTIKFIRRRRQHTCQFSNADGATWPSIITLWERLCSECVDTGQSLYSAIILRRGCHCPNFTREETQQKCCEEPAAQPCYPPSSLGPHRIFSHRTQSCCKAILTLPLRKD